MPKIRFSEFAHISNPSTSDSINVSIHTKTRTLIANIYHFTLRFDLLVPETFTFIQFIVFSYSHTPPRHAPTIRIDFRVFHLSWWQWCVPVCMYVCVGVCVLMQFHVIHPVYVFIPSS